MNFLTRDLVSPLHMLIAGLLLFASIFSVAFAHGYVMVTGNLPCELCLAQRVPYYYGIPITALALLLAWRGGPALIVRLLMICFAGLMLYGMSVAIYHAGVEWKFWAGPSACSGGGLGGTPTNAADMLSQLSAGPSTIVRCDQPYFRVLGLSFAGWNTLYSLFLAGLALFGATRISRLRLGALNRA